MTRIIGAIAVCVLLACGGDAPASREAERSVQRWHPPDADLDSNAIRVSVVDLASGEPLRATFCLAPAIDTVLTTDSSGVATLKLTGSGNLRTWVWAPGHATEYLTFMPGRRGRMQVVVQLARDPSRNEEPRCEFRVG